MVGAAHGMTARDDILAAIRAGRDSVAEMDLEPAYIRHCQLGHAERIGRFARRLADYHVTVLRALSAGSVGDIVARQLAARRIASVAVPDDLPAAWCPMGMMLHRESALSHADLDRVSGVITGCLLGVAETGTIVLDGGRHQGGRALTLLPDYHICVVFESQVVGIMPEAIEGIRASVLDGAAITFISGPSATADIELDRVEGVHGPRTLDVVIVGGRE